MNAKVFYQCQRMQGVVRVTKPVARSAMNNWMDCKMSRHNDLLLLRCSYLASVGRVSSLCVGVYMLKKCIGLYLYTLRV